MIRAGTFEPGLDNYTAQPEAVAVHYGTHTWRFPILFFGLAIVWIAALGAAGAVVGFWIVVAGAFPLLWGWGRGEESWVWPRKVFLGNPD